MERDHVMVGVVAYDAKVVPIWEGIRAYFRDAPVQMDVVWFTHYDALVEALLAGWVDIAWNTNLAYVRTHRATEGKCRVLAMRDTDVGFRTLLVGRAGEITDVKDLPGKTLAVGSSDSLQATIMPMHYLTREGMDAGAGYDVLRFESDVGTHGDTGTSEREALMAVIVDRADAAAVGAASWDALVRGGDVPPERLAPFWTSPPYNHCNFTTISLDEERAAAWAEHLLKMDWGNPEHRRILELEGLHRWVEPELDGYRDVFRAVEEQGLDARW